MLFSIDAFRPEFCQDQRWPMPTLQQLASEGAYAERVRSVFPALTYPAHTTMVTGALPARHGIAHNRPFEPGGQSGRSLWEASHIAVPTLWQTVRAAGWTERRRVLAGYRGRRDRLERARRVACRRRRFDGGDPCCDDSAWALRRVGARGAGPFRPENFSIRRLGREDRVGAIAAYLLERYRPTLLLVHCIGTDHVQHERGRDNPMVRRAVGAADRAIGQVLETVERLGLRARTAFVLVGDHGSAAIHTQLRPNIWLVEAGLMEDRPDRGRWRATFFASGGSAFLVLREPADQAAAALVRQALDAQPRGVRSLFRVIDRDELNALGADPRAPLALAASPGVEIHKAASSPVLSARTGAAHGYLPDEPAMHTGFVAGGAGIRAGVVVPELRLEQVAPLVAALLGIAFNAPDGVLLPGLLAD